jgi:hypothetical protein
MWDRVPHTVAYPRLLALGNPVFEERRLGGVLKKEENGPTVGERSGVKEPAWPLFAGLALGAFLIGMVAVSCGGATGGQRAQDSQDPTGNETQAVADLGHPP